MKRITVYCGSSAGNKPVYAEQAGLTGKELAKRGIEIIFGGGQVGLMGILADAALKEGGRVTGIIPGFLQTKEVAHHGLSKMIRVDNMHERKAMMFEMSDAFMALPGGYGTMDELFEMLTWAQLGLHPKPVGILNINAFFDPILNGIQNMVDEGFLKKINQEILLVDNRVEDVLEKMSSYKALEVPKWL